MLFYVLVLITEMGKWFQKALKNGYESDTAKIGGGWLKILTLDKSGFYM